MLYAALIINYPCQLLQVIPSRLQLLKEMLLFLNNAPRYFICHHHHSIGVSLCIVLSNMFNICHHQSILLLTISQKEH